LIALDASVLVAFLSRDDAHHRASLALLADDDAIRIHTVNLAESLVGSVRKGRGAQAMSRLQTIGVLEVAPVRDEAIRLAELRAATRLKLPDCCVILVAEEQRSALATFDDRLARAARARGIPVIDGSSR
jgi:predicted nucleic acid-binding protein